MLDNSYWYKQHEIWESSPPNIIFSMAYNESAMKMELYKFEHLQKMYTTTHAV